MGCRQDPPVVSFVHVDMFTVQAGYTANGRKVGGCTQPRPVAAMSIAARVAEEMGTKVGYGVGYSIQIAQAKDGLEIYDWWNAFARVFEGTGSRGLLCLNRLITDDAHKRTFSTDILFAFGQGSYVCHNSPSNFDFPWKGYCSVSTWASTIISSATIDAEKFSDYFDYAPTFYGQLFPWLFFVSKNLNIFTF